MGIKKYIEVNYNVLYEWTVYGDYILFPKKDSIVCIEYDAKYNQLDFSYYDISKFSQEDLIKCEKAYKSTRLAKKMYPKSVEEDGYLIVNDKEDIKNKMMEYYNNNINIFEKLCIELGD